MKTISLNRLASLTALLFVMSFSVAFGQQINKDGTSVKPKEHITVNKKYDENGNLIQYDSTYTYESSSFGIDSADMESFFEEFPNFFNQQPMGHFAPPSLFENNSAFPKDFFSDDFFEKRFMQRDEDLLKMMRRMDSLKMEFFEGFGDTIKYVK